MGRLGKWTKKQARINMIRKFDDKATEWSDERLNWIWETLPDDVQKMLEEVFIFDQDNLVSSVHRENFKKYKTPMFPKYYIKGHRNWIAALFHSGETAKATYNKMKGKPKKIFKKYLKKAGVNKV